MSSLPPISDGTSRGRLAGDPGTSDVAVRDDLLFRPIVDIDAGSVLAVEVETPGPATGAQSGDTAAQAQQLARLARRVVAEEPLLPLVLPLPSAAVMSGPTAFELVENELRRAGRRPRDITLMLGPDLRDIPRAALVRGVRGLRERGFRCAFGTSSVPPDLLLEADPFLLRIDPEIVAGVPSDDRRSAVIEGLVLIGRGSGIYPMATGVATVAQLVKLRDIGLRLAHGPFFAADEWRPGGRVNPVPDPSVTSEVPELGSGPRVSEFMGPPVAVTAEATAEEVLDAFTNDPALNSVILIDHRERPLGLIDRSRFLLAITGPYGHALHARRPAERLADSPRTVARGLPAMAALRAAGTDRDRVYDDLITVNEFGQCTGIVHVSDLIRSLARADHAVVPS
ncbi:EAL domain-containing protein (putative c-di-GMP-specific phosphodiesterase class I) [Lipingzhangella halophila]|uniref:EAL domain-containing protein (Putative c-di-GMP-specific phosphodiesterase class I) n=1 Tax=Lipingzhangella halophila TaxID=1783352 RepID=A0A7W7RI48_9ACTN|nr:EAL domain-containing protein [Lipingzhangella halophila]MBB4932389.1 EAL domain-containing protein (putative c-di-GMP-specific phosphodiesterase class I) [Lipingzhangella halophila]